MKNIREGPRVVMNPDGAEVDWTVVSIVTVQLETFTVIFSLDGQQPWGMGGEGGLFLHFAGTVT